MTKANTNDIPTVPDGPSTPQDAVDTPRPTPQPAVEPREARVGDSKGQTGGRRKYEEILAENAVLAARVAELTAAAQPFARIQYDSSKPAEHVEYQFSRGAGRTGSLTVAQFRALRGALGLE